MKKEQARQDRANEVLTMIHNRVSLIDSTWIDIGVALTEIETEEYYLLWGYFSFTTWLLSSGTNIKVRKSQYLRTIVKNAAILNIDLQRVKAIGVAKSRLIFSLDPKKYEIKVRTLIERADKLSPHQIWSEIVTDVEGKQLPTRCGWSFTPKQSLAVSKAIALAKGDRNTSDSQSLAEICKAFVSARELNKYAWTAVK